MSRPVAVSPDGRDAHSRWRNRHGPGRSGDRGSPGNGNGHSETAVRSDSSASLTDERWKYRVLGATLTLLCDRTVGA
ncbi:MAG: hypothetical protein WBM81_12940 [Sedimenticolaceae bacterium]